MSTLRSRVRHVAWNVTQVLGYTTLVLIFGFGCGDCSGLPRLAVSKAPHRNVSKSNAKAPQNTYVSVRARKADTGATVRVIHDVHPPFRFDTKIGDFSKKPRSWGAGTVGVSMFDPAVLGLVYHEVKVSQDGDDLLVRFGDGAAGPEPLRLVGTTVAEISFEHTGTEMVYRARTPGSGAFQEVGRVAESYTGPFRGSLDLADLAKKATPGMDDPLVLFSADPPDLSTAASRAQNEMARGTEQVLRALAAADAADPDGEAATGAMDAAMARFTQCRIELETFGKAGKKAANKVKAASNKVDAGRRKIAQGKPPSKAVGKLSAALKTLRKAFQKLP